MAACWARGSVAAAARLLVVRLQAAPFLVASRSTRVAVRCQHFRPSRWTSSACGKAVAEQTCVLRICGGIASALAPRGCLARVAARWAGKKRYAVLSLSRKAV